MKTLAYIGAALTALAPVCLMAAGTFWTLDTEGKITHEFTENDPVVLCMQGRKVVMQVQADGASGFTYQARFFNVLVDPDRKKKVIFTGGAESIPEVKINGKPMRNGLPSAVHFDGKFTLHRPEADGVVLTRTTYPSMDKALVIEEWQVRNTSGAPITVAVKPARKEIPLYDRVAVVWDCPEVKAESVKPGSVISFHTSVQARLVKEPDLVVKVDAERAARDAVATAAWRGPGRLETPEPELDAAFALQKFHVLECPIETGQGIITHNGSLTYSPGIWANDPVEYSSPVFPFFGDAGLNRASMKMYHVWQDYCKEHGIDPFPGSFEHADLKLTQKERGDDAMVLYGLAKFLLFQGDRAAAEELWPLIEFSAASVLKNTTDQGIVASKTDEMEGRYPTGDANLSTSALAYGGYRLAANLARSLGKPVAAEFDTRADALRKSIDSYFAATVEGFETYRYYEGNTTLRGWILLPLAMDITERQEGTVAALLSDKLWPDREKGADILAESTRPTEWGRETYYALRVLFKAGRTEEAIDLTRRVVRTQIFGSKGPYPDEDAIDMLCPGSLYPRVFTEGMFGIVPTGLDSFECTPWLPKEWPRMALRDVRAFGRAWDMVVERDGEQQKITISSGGQTIMTTTAPAGKTVAVTFPKVGQPQSGAVMPSLDVTYGEARAETTGNMLRVTTGKVERTWALTPKGLRTTGITDLRGHTRWADEGSSHPCDWRFPGIDGDCRLVSLTAERSDDQGFTSEHLKVVATFEYAADNLSLRYVIWAYPDAEGLRTQCQARLLHESAGSPVGDSAGEGIVDSLPIRAGGRTLHAIGYYAGTQNRNTHEQEILRQETQSDCPPQGEIDWASVVAVREADKGMVMVKESHKCVNTPEMGANTGGFAWDSEGLRNTGSGWYLKDLTADRYRDCWATWTVLYQGGDDEMGLAMKVFDRQRYPVDPDRDIYILANTWGSGEGMRASRMQAREDNIMAELDSQADLGIDVQQIDDGWQGHDFKNWRPLKSFELKEDDAIYSEYQSETYPVYPEGWSKVRNHAKQKDIKLGLWAAVNIPVEDLIWNYDHGDFHYFKMDYASLPTMAQVEELTGKARKLILHSGQKVRINWDVTEKNPRVGYFFGREYGNIYLANRKLRWPKDVVYKPYLVLRDAWQISDYLNLNKFQITIQNRDLTDPDISDAYQHSHDYCLVQTLMGSPIFFQETRLYDKAARDLLRPVISLYKEHRDEMFRGYVFPIGDKPDNESWSGFQNHDPDSRTGYLTILRQLHNDLNHQSIRLKFLAGRTIQINDLQTKEERTVKVPADGKVDFTIDAAPGYLFLKYTLME